MKELLKKEMTLTAAPLSYIFILFSAMTMIPGYPILVGAFFVSLGIFYTFQFAREYNDVLYTALLPVKKSDVVLARYLFVVAIQLIAFLLDAVLTALRMTALHNVGPYATNALMSANLAFLGYTLLIFALFNMIFLAGFFKTAYYYGKPFLIFCVAAFVVVTLAEVLWHIPGLTWLGGETGNGLAYQAAVLAAGAVIYAAGTFWSLRRSQRCFEKIDL